MSARLRAWFRVTSVVPASCEAGDGDLVRQFVETRAEAAFAELVRRHGPMVLATCRRILNPDVHTADDAFQATFLVLATKAAGVSPPERVGAFLHGVAVHVAQKARAWARKLVSSAPADLDRVPAALVAADADAGELRAKLDDALAGLPSKYRSAVVLCDLEGRSRTEAAGLLGWSEGTLSSRLARARKLLADRLARRGVTVPLIGGVGVLLPAPAVLATVPGQLAASTLRAAALVAAGTATGEAVPASVAALARGIPMHTNFKLLAVVLTGAALVFVALGLYVPPTDPPALPDKSRVETDPPAPVEDGWALKHAVTALAFGPDSIAVGDAAGGLVLWDAKTGKGRARLRDAAQSAGPDKRIDHLRFSADGTKVLAVISRSSIHQFPIAKNGAVLPFGEPVQSGWATVGITTNGEGWVHTSQKRSAAAVSPNRLEGGVIEWFAIYQFAHTDTVTHAAAGDDSGTAVASVAGIKNPVLRLWSQFQAKPLWETDLGPIRVNGLVVSPSGTFIAVRGAAGQVQIFDAKTGKLLTKTEKFTGTVTSVAFSPDDKQIVAGGVDKTARVFDTETGEELAVLKGHTDAVTSVAFSPSGVTIATGSNDKTVKLWEFKKAEPKRIDKATVAAWEKLGFEVGWMWIDEHSQTGVFSTISTGIRSAVPAFRSRSAVKNLKNLPPVAVPFGLHVASIRVTDEDLNDLARLKNLTTLDLRDATIAGNSVGTENEALKNFAGLTSLTALHIWGTQITEVGVKELGTLKSLTALTLAGARLDATRLKELAGLVNLTYLDVSSSRSVGDEGLKHLTTLKKLTVLKLAYTDVTDEGLAHLTGMPNLTYLDLTSTRRVGDAGAKHLAGLTNLTTLLLIPNSGGQESEVTDAGLRDLATLKKLTRLELGSSKMTDAGVKHLAGLPDLTTLALAHGAVTGAGLVPLSNNRNLTLLNLRNIPLTDAGLKELTALKSLTRLDLSYTKVTDAGMEEFQKALPKCQINPRK